MDEVVAKFMANARYGGWPAARAEALADWARGLFDRRDVSALRDFAG